eukprot:m51a1_g4883 putative nucleolin (814) ;mRNA; r:41493-44128
MAEDRWPQLVSELDAMGLEPSTVTEDDVRGLMRELGATTRETLAVVARWRSISNGSSTAAPTPARAKRSADEARCDEGGATPAAKKRAVAEAEDRTPAKKPVAVATSCSQTPTAQKGGQRTTAAAAAGREEQPKPSAAAAATPQAKKPADESDDEFEAIWESFADDSAPSAPSAARTPSKPGIPSIRTATPASASRRTQGPASPATPSSRAASGIPAVHSSASPARPAEPLHSVYVSSLPWSWKPVDLRRAFEEAGVAGVVRARVVLEKFTNRSKGFGFVDFATLADAQAAVTAMRGKVYEQRELGVEVSAPKQPSASGRSEEGSGSAALEQAAAFSLWVGGITFSLTEQELREAFEQNGCGADLAAVRMLRNKTGFPLGYGFVDFRTYEGAMAALAKMNGFTLGDRRLNVKLNSSCVAFKSIEGQSKAAEQQQQKQQEPVLKKPKRGSRESQKVPGEQRKSAHSVVTRGLPLSWTTEDLRKAFVDACEGVVSARVFTKGSTKRSKGFGFVDFATHEEAQAAAQAMNGKIFDEQQLIVELSAPAGGKDDDNAESSGQMQAEQEIKPSAASAVKKTKTVKPADDTEQVDEEPCEAQDDADEQEAEVKKNTKKRPREEDKQQSESESEEEEEEEDTVVTKNKNAKASCKTVHEEAEEEEEEEEEEEVETVTPKKDNKASRVDEQESAEAASDAEEAEEIARKPAKSGKPEQKPAQAAASSGNPELANATSIWVGNVPYVTTEQKLRKLFERSGCEGITAVRLSYNRSGKPLGYGWIDFATHDAAAHAVEHMNGTNVGVRELTVKLSAASAASAPN